MLRIVEWKRIPARIDTRIRSEVPVSKMTLRVRLKRLRRYASKEQAYAELSDRDYSLTSTAAEQQQQYHQGNKGSWNVLQHIPGLILSQEETSFDNTEQTLEHTAQLDHMIRLLDRLDGRRSVTFKKKKRGVIVASGELHKVSQSQSFDSQDTEEDTRHDVRKQPFEALHQSPSITKRITWADECTDSPRRPLVTLHQWNLEPEACIRLVILLLHPIERKFEFVHCEYDNMEPDNRVSVRDCLSQLASMASNPVLQNLHFTALCWNDKEMINCMTLQDFDLQEGELLVAIPEGHHPKEVLQQAANVLSNKGLQRMVRKAKLTGRALQRLFSSREIVDLAQAAAQGEADVNNGGDKISHTTEQDQAGTDVDIAEQRECAGSSHTPTLPLHVDGVPSSPSRDLAELFPQWSPQFLQEEEERDDCAVDIDFDDDGDKLVQHGKSLAFDAVPVPSIQSHDFDSFVWDAEGLESSVAFDCFLFPADLQEETEVRESGPSAEQEPDDPWIPIRYDEPGDEELDGTGNSEHGALTGSNGKDETGDSTMDDAAPVALSEMINDLSFTDPMQHSEAVSELDMSLPLASERDADDLKKKDQGRGNFLHTVGKGLLLSAAIIFASDRR